MLGTQTTRLLAAVALIAATSSACDPIDDVGRRLGLWTDGEGEVMVEYLLCPGELVEGVELRKYSGVTDYEVIWAIRAEPPSTRQTFVIGFVPRGFVDSVTLKEDLVASVDYGVFVDSTDQSIAINTFTLDELSETSVLTSWKNESVSRAEFAAGRDANC